MNDFEKLDQRAHRAAGDLRTRAAARPRPAFDPADANLLPAPARISDHRSRRPFLAAAAVILLVLAAGLALVIRHQGDDGDGPASPTNTTEPPRPFVATDLPKGLALAGAADPTSTGSAGGDPFGPLQIFGRSVDRPELGVGSLPVTGPDDLADTKRVEVDGRTVLTYDDAGLGSRVVIVRRGARAIYAMSPVLDRSTLASVAQATQLDGNDVQVPTDVLPDGFSRLGTEAEPLTSNGVFAMRGGAIEQSVAVYMGGKKSAGKPDASDPGPDDSAMVTISSMAGDEARLQAVRLWATETEKITVRGHAALLTTSTFPQTDPGVRVANRMVTWIERPGELLRVSGYGVSADELQAVADGVRPVGAKEWADLLERTRLGEFKDAVDNEPSVEVGRGRFADGTAWRLAVNTNEGSTDGSATETFVTPDLSVALGGSSDSSSGTSSGSGGTDTAAFLSNTTLDQGGRHFGAGIVNPSVDAVELRRSDGSVIERAQMIEGAGYRAWVVELSVDPTTAVALGADGQELDRVTFSNLDQNESPQISEGSSATTIPGN